MINRRTFLGSASMAAAWPALRVVAQAASFATLPASIAALERSNGCRIGFAAVDTQSGRRAEYRGGERFPMCSTFKWLLAAVLLAEVDRGRASLDQTLPIPATGLLPHSPLTEPHAGGNMTLAALARAAIIQSDNTAANLLLARVGDPAGYTRGVRALGDPVTRLDRNEPTLNECRPGDPRDTSTPQAMVADLDRILLGNALSAASRTRLSDWMLANETGGPCLKAGLPADWRIGDKTGSDGATTRNDIAIVWPSGRKPVLIAAFVTECKGTDDQRNGILAQIGSLVAHAV